MNYRLLCISVLTLFLSFTARGDKMPNILMIAVDDLRPMLGCYGDERMHTPNIDRLAADGLVFDRAYCQYAKCGTSRLSLMTGLRPDSVGVFSNNHNDVRRFRERRPDAVSMAQWFKENGYDTRGFGKIYHDGWDRAEEWSVPPSPGRDSEMLEVVDAKNPTAPTTIAVRTACPVFQSPDVEDDHLFAGRMTNKVIDVLKHKTEKPFFLALGYRRPHLPFVAPKKYFDLYEPDESWLTKVPEPSAGIPVAAWYNSDGYVGTAKKLGLTMPKRPEREAAVSWNGFEMRSYLGVPPKGEISTELQLDLIHAYAACISYVDAQVGKILDVLEAQDLRKNTTIVFWSDHGWHLGEHSAWGKMTNYEIATRVPFIISSPAHSNGRTDSIAELVDLYPTLCDLAGLDSPKHLEGESLLEVLQSPETKESSVARSQYLRFKDMMGKSLRTDQYRYTRWEKSGTGELVFDELYDHQNDPGETNNLVNSKSPEHRTALSRLQKLQW